MKNLLFDDFLKEHGLDWGKRYMAKPDGSIVEISSINKQ